MDKSSKDKDSIWVITSDIGAITRGGGAPRQLKIEELSVNINLFLEQLGQLLEKTPEKVGKFQFDEFEIHADITAQGTVAILGSGIQAGAAGGLRFTFRRRLAASEEI
jgi:hypothetical protein